MRRMIAVVLLLSTLGCSSERDRRGDEEFEDAGGGRGHARGDGGAAAGGDARRDGEGADGAAARGRPEASGAPAAAGPAVVYTGTFQGRTEVPDGGMPDGGAVWQGEGTVRLEVRGEAVQGAFEGQGLALEARGNLTQQKVRAWLTAKQRPGAEGLMTGDASADGLRGTWRVSGSAGDDVRTGAFEAHR